MSISLTNPPYLFTTKPIVFRGRRIERVVQIYGKPGEIGRVMPHKLNRKLYAPLPSGKVSRGLTVA